MWVKLVGRKVPDSIVEARASYQLQRGVPCDGQSHVGKKQWKEPGGTTLNEAPAWVLRKRVRDEKELCSNSVAVLAWLWITVVLVKAVVHRFSADCQERWRKQPRGGRSVPRLRSALQPFNDQSASSATSRDGGVDWTHFVTKIAFLAQ